jgi:hypothetical protein
MVGLMTPIGAIPSPRPSRPSPEVAPPAPVVAAPAARDRRLALDDRPPQPKMMTSASCSAAASTMPSAAWRPMRTMGWMVVPSGA